MRTSPMSSLMMYGLTVSMNTVDSTIQIGKEQRKRDYFCDYDSYSSNKNMSSISKKTPQQKWTKRIFSNAWILQLFKSYSVFQIVTVDNFMVSFNTASELTIMSYAVTNFIFSLSQQDTRSMGNQ